MKENRLQVRLSNEERAALEAHAGSLDDDVSLAAAARDLVRIGLGASDKDRRAAWVSEERTRAYRELSRCFGAVKRALDAGASADEVCAALRALEGKK